MTIASYLLKQNNIPGPYLTYFVTFMASYTEHLKVNEICPHLTILIGTKRNYQYLTYARFKKKEINNS